MAAGGLGEQGEEDAVVDVALRIDIVFEAAVLHAVLDVYKRPPPERYTPRSSMSAASSGGVFSNASRMFSSSAVSGGRMARLTSLGETDTVEGLPVRTSRPRKSTSSAFSPSSCRAEPISIFRSSAVRWPMPSPF